MALPAERVTSTDLQLPPYIARNLAGMSIDDARADVTLTCKERSMKCHRTVLTMYSNVIGTMLRPETAELKFEDENFEVLEKAIRYLYGSDLVITAQDVLPLLRFADTYDVRTSTFMRLYTVFVIYCASKLHVFQCSLDAQLMTSTVHNIQCICCAMCSKIESELFTLFIMYFNVVVFAPSCSSLFSYFTEAYNRVRSTMYEYFNDNFWLSRSQLARSYKKDTLTNTKITIRFHDFSFSAN